MRGLPAALRVVAAGLVAGAALPVFLCLASSALAAVTGSAVGVPGFFLARTLELNGASAVTFTPDWGLVALAGLCALVVGGASAARRL
jgi:hypothetical protein